MAACEDRDCRDFLRQLEELRSLAKDMSMHRLLWRVYNQLNSRANTTATSMEEKKSSSSWTAQGMFRSARARVYSRNRGPGERMSTI